MHSLVGGQGCGVMQFACMGAQRDRVPALTPVDDAGAGNIERTGEEWSEVAGGYCVVID